ncbi:zinc-dependent alcohol dehydrogenase [Paenibacillus sacheonensis]|uniref:Zinc-binding dehydrogenase n=1 Tax=Paenibacillus sacheonensis TaxID=742054 RepID=A0A7X5BYM7_9BACL|nr:zinc-binding alcohol dehydrogenase [Paenibacillus sacheonensis]MBM7569241.1 threonine dehydrogenase-like Zn-dependent dehydrogenase [Paenibacillus sacheonensis]NBC71748.1 zinc-binding dehydrogenase [Paenibacillus sacheonensis]
MPNQLIAVAPRKAALLPYEDNETIRPDQVKIRVEYASPKHGSELADFRGLSPFVTDVYDDEWHAFLPRAEAAEPQAVFGKWNLGNQYVGVITEIGSEVTDFAVGERVCGYSGIRETVVTASRNLLKMPESMSWKSAVCYDPAHFALSAVRDANVRLGDRVAVFGLGALGQLAAQMARLAGASYVAVIDPIEKRRQVAMRAGADAGYDPTVDDVGFLLKQDTGKLGVDVIIETSANEFALQQALRGLAYGGTIAFIGWARAFKGGMDWGREAHFNNAKIVFSRACSEPNPDHPRWDFKRIREACWDLLASGAIDCEEIIHPVVPFEQSAEAYETYVDQKPEASIKLGVSLTGKGCTE